MKRIIFRIILLIFAMALVNCTAMAETLRIECVCNDEQFNSVGHDWIFDVEVNGNSIEMPAGGCEAGEVITASCAVDGESEIKLKITEDDPAYNDESKQLLYSIKKGETIKDEITVSEHNGSSANRSCTWNITITVE